MSTEGVRDWGVAWFGQHARGGVCQRCQQARPVYQGYNGGQYMGVGMCASCCGPAVAETRAACERQRPKPVTESTL